MQHIASLTNTRFITQTRDSSHKHEIHHTSRTLVAVELTLRTGAVEDEEERLTGAAVEDTVVAFMSGNLAESLALRSLHVRLIIHVSNSVIVAEAPASIMAGGIWPSGGWSAVV